MTDDEACARWVDLLDPTPEGLRAALPASIHPKALALLTAPAEHADEPRPLFRAEGEYVLGIFLVPVLVEAEDRIFYQQIDLVLWDGAAVTVRKTPPDLGHGDSPFAVDEIAAAIAADHAGSAGMIGYHVVDEVAERFLDLADCAQAEIDELEDSVETTSGEDIRTRLSDLRHDLLHIRRVLAPTRDAIRSVIDNRVELESSDGAAVELFPRDVELHFADAFDKLLRAADAIELCRDLLGGVRDYHQSKVSMDQNEVMKRLTVVASLLLLPTLIVGVYGQNFDVMPELHWHYGYAFSWLLIVLTTIGQLWFFRRKRWF